MKSLREKFVNVRKVFLTNTMEVIRSFLQHMRCSWKHNFLEKKAIFPVRKKILPPFSRSIKCGKPQRTVCKGLQGFFIVTVLVIISILQDLRGCWKVENTFFFWKKGKLSSEVKILAYFFSFYWTEQRSKNVFWGPTKFVWQFFCS